jgi:hypothetical protein
MARFELDKKRFRVKQCPCGKSNKDGKFVPYVGYEDKGYCHSCGQTFLPESLKDERYATLYGKPITRLNVATPLIQCSYITDAVFRTSLKDYESNLFVKFLKGLFGIEITSQLIARYFIGTSEHWNGAVIFWQRDMMNRVRDGKVMLYNTETGRRVKHPFNFITWMHSILKMSEYNLQQCFFGEHLLALYPDLPIAIVESEKTAIIASIYFPQFIWIATGGKNGCKWTTWKVCKVLKGRKVVLWPDVNAFQDWKVKLEILLGYGLQVSISNLLEQEANEAERRAGLDIADYLVRFPVEQFNLNSNKHPP